MLKLLSYLSTFPERIYRKLRAFIIKRDLRQYKSSIHYDHPFFGFPMKNIGDCSGNPVELFTHYDAFSFWAAKQIFASSNQLSILDVGSKKLMNAVFSVSHDVTSLVLANCDDQISNVKYIRHDISEPLPFKDNSFDVFTSTATLNLAGLKRYGDRLDSYVLPHFIVELNRVLRPKGKILISMCLGKNILQFNNGWFLDIDTLIALFPDWRLIDVLVDERSSPETVNTFHLRRFTTDTSVEKYPVGHHRVAFLHFEH